MSNLTPKKKQQQAKFTSFKLQTVRYENLILYSTFTKASNMSLNDTSTSSKLFSKKTILFFFVLLLYLTSQTSVDSWLPLIDFLTYFNLFLISFFVFRWFKYVIIILFFHFWNFFSNNQYSTSFTPNRRVTVNYVIYCCIVRRFSLRQFKFFVVNVFFPNFFSSRIWGRAYFVTASTSFNTIIKLIR